MNRITWQVAVVWQRVEGVRTVVGYRAQRITSRGQHRFVAPLRADHAAADLDARTAAQRAAGLAA